MTLDQAITVKLKSVSAVNNALGGRIYLRDNVPQGAGWPRATVEQTELSPVHDCSGPITNTTKDAEVEVIVFDKNAISVRNLSGFVRSVLDGFRGTIAFAGQSVAVDKLHLEEEIPENTAPEPGTNTVIYGQRQAYRAHYR